MNNCAISSEGAILLFTEAELARSFVSELQENNEEMLDENRNSFFNPSFPALVKQINTDMLVNCATGNNWNSFVLNPLSDFQISFQLSHLTLTGAEFQGAKAFMNVQKKTEFKDVFHTYKK